MKKPEIIILSILFLLIPSFAYSSPLTKVNEYRLENDFTVFLLQDPSSATIQIELNVKAGFSCQTQNTNGFFTLYANLIKAAAPSLNFDMVSCNSDNTTFTITTVPSKLSQVLFLLSDGVFNLSYSDELLNSQLQDLKNTVNQSAKDAGTILNAAIDSKVFSAAPWKHNSGIYPALFNKTTPKQARAILSEIGLKWYTPQNSAIFISGNIDPEQTNVLLKNSFGRFSSQALQSASKPLVPVNKNHKFVLHNSEFSPDMTQVIVQYTMLNMDQADLISQALNNPSSAFKTGLLQSEALGIPGDEYINVASAHKKDSSRVIFQTLLLPPENKKLKTTSCRQAVEFVNQVKAAGQTLTSIDYTSAALTLQNQLNMLQSDSKGFMESLCDFWTTLPYQKASYIENPEPANSLSQTASLMDFRYKQLLSEDFDLISKIQTAEEPFVFVIINDSDYKKTKKEYAAQGFEEINSSNSSWYMQSLFQEIKDQFKPEDEGAVASTVRTTDNGFYQKNLSQIKYSTLNNGINIITKENPLCEGTTLLLSVKGGKLNSSDNPGFEEVMISILSGNIQRELASGNSLVEYYNIQHKTDLTTSSIWIDFNSQDLSQVCRAISNALIYSTIPPAAGDRAVSSRQYKKRLENGSAVNQMYSASINTLFPKSALSRIYESSKDILETTNFYSILEAYPKLLDANRYTVILTGNIPDEYQTFLENTLGLLNPVAESSYTKPVFQLQLPENKSQNVKITHTFLTDIPAEKAGPMPAVLIPTTEFLDPVLYFIKAPDCTSREYTIFNALLNYMEEDLQNTVLQNKRIKDAKVQINKPDSTIPAACIIINNVAHTKEADAAYRTCIKNLKTRLLQEDAQNTVVQRIKDLWTLKELPQSISNSGTALLLQTGLEQSDSPSAAALYLQNYNLIQNATVMDFLSAVDFLPDFPPYRLYSTQGKN